MRKVMFAFLTMVFLLVVHSADAQSHYDTFVNRVHSSKTKVYVDHHNRSTSRIEREGRTCGTPAPPPRRTCGTTVNGYSVKEKYRKRRSRECCNTHTTRRSNCEKRDRRGRAHYHNADYDQRNRARCSRDHKRNRCDRSNTSGSYYYTKADRPKNRKPKYRYY